MLFLVTLLHTKQGVGLSGSFMLARAYVICDSEKDTLLQAAHPLLFTDEAVGVGVS